MVALIGCGCARVASSISVSKVKCRSSAPTLRASTCQPSSLSKAELHASQTVSARCFGRTHMSNGLLMSTATAYSVLSTAQKMPEDR